MTEIVDTNVYVGTWPFRHLYGAEIGDLVAKLRSAGAVEAWVGTFDALWQRDLADANRRIVEVCKNVEGVKLVPFGSINPQLPDWHDDLRRCVEIHGMPGIRLHPNYHGYALDAPVAGELLDEAAARGLLVQIALSMEDERTQSVLARVPHVDPAPLKAHLKRLPKLRIQLINAFRSIHPQKVAAYADWGELYFDIAMLEGMARLPKLIAAVSHEHVLFGSYFPFFYHESATLKLQEGGLPHETLEIVTNRNARRLLTNS